MRYSASEKAEIIQLVEQSHLPAKRTLDKLGIPRATLYRWYDRYRTGGLKALSDHLPDRFFLHSLLHSDKGKFHSDLNAVRKVNMSE